MLSKADRAAEDTVRDSDEDLIVEENVCKVPVLKRKQMNDISGSQAKKGPVTRSRDSQQEEKPDCEADMEEEEGEEKDCAEDSQPHTDSQQSAGSQQQEKPYEVQQVKKFLQETKNMKKVRIEDYFVDKELLFLSVRSQMRGRGKGGYTDQEIYRLKKIVQKLHNRNNIMMRTQKLCKTVCLPSVLFCVTSHIRDHE